MTRPHTIADIAARAHEGHGAFDRAVREFIDTWQSLSKAGRDAALAREPERLNPLMDAYLAALAEHLALIDRMDVPEWTEQPERFLREPFFAGGLESVKAILLVESPLAFRRRLIFISSNALSRPSREFIPDHAPNVAPDM